MQWPTAKRKQLGDLVAAADQWLAHLTWSHNLDSDHAPGGVSGEGILVDPYFAQLHSKLCEFAESLPEVCISAEGQHSGNIGPGGLHQ